LLDATGADRTQEYKQFHNPDVMKKYHEKFCVGTMESGPKKEAYVDFGDPLWLQRFQNSPYYSASHRAFQKNVRKFVEEEILSDMSWEKKDRPPQALLEKMGQEGYLAILTGSTEAISYLPASVQAKIPR
jgi:hypothetical protein